MKRTISVLSHSPSPEDAYAIGAQIAAEDFETQNFEYSITMTLPSNIDESAAEMLFAQKSRIGENAVFFTVLPK